MIHSPSLNAHRSAPITINHSHVQARYTSDYAARPIVTAPLDASSSSLHSGSGLPNKWYTPPWLDDDAQIINESLIIDDIDTYLSEPPIPASSVAAAGGALKWWYAQEKQRPTVGLMAMDFISAPPTSVEAERQFSTGRRSMNFMQHNMLHDTFRARMALGSWDNTPMFPGFEAAAHIIDSYMA